jgi:hypothetical protein
MQNLFFQLAEQSGDVFWIAQPKPLKVLYVSPSFERITEWTQPGYTE